MAGQGNTVGGKFEELQQIIHFVKNKKRLGVCLDTCHIFAAGPFCNAFLIVVIYKIREARLCIDRF